MWQQNMPQTTSGETHHSLFPGGHLSNYFPRGASGESDAELDALLRVAVHVFLVGAGGCVLRRPSLRQDLQRDLWPDSWLLPEVACCLPTVCYAVRSALAGSACQHFSISARCARLVPSASPRACLASLSGSCLGLTALAFRDPSGIGWSVRGGYSRCGPRRVTSAGLRRSEAVRA